MPTKNFSIKTHKQQPFWSGNMQQPKPGAHADMQAAMSAMAATSSIQPYESRSKARDYIFSTMQHLASTFSNGPTLQQPAQQGVAESAMNIALISATNVSKLTPDVVNTLLDFLHHSSSYIVSKAQHCVELVVQCADLSRQCTDTVTAHMRSVVLGLSKLPPPENQNSNDEANRRLLIWAMDMLLHTARVDEDSFLGCLFGTAVGDAVGLPVEGSDKITCQSYANLNILCQPVQVPSAHRSNWTFGQYSDDTQQSREMYLTVLQGKGRMDPQVYALRTAMLFQPGAFRVVGYGKTSAEAAKRIWDGANYADAGSTSTGTGNGSVMRSACLAVLLSGKPTHEIVNTAHIMSAITHAMPGAKDAAAAIALAARYASATRHLPFHFEHFVQYVADGVAAGNPESKLPGFIKELVVLKDKPFDVAVARCVEIGVKSNGEKAWTDAAGSIVISCGCWQTALWALWCFTECPNCYNECIGRAIGAGGDADTTAATAGGIVGARVGAAAIPELWKMCLHDHNIHTCEDEWMCGQLLKLGKEVFALVDGGKVTAAV